MKCEKSGSHTIFYQSLLLSTIILNDSAAMIWKFYIIKTLDIIYHKFFIIIIMYMYHNIEIT